MSKTSLIILISIVSVVLIVTIRILLPFGVAPIRVSAEAIPGLVIPIPGSPIQVTNSLLATWLTMILLVLFALWIHRSLQMIPGRRQNFAEMIIETFYDLTVSVGGEKWAPHFFPVIMTIFLFVLVSNLLDPLTPLLAAIGIKRVEHGYTEIIPLLRSPSTDLNFPIALALISVGLTQFYGIRAHGFFGYLGRFINVSGLVRFVQVLMGKRKGNAFGALFMGLIDFFMGIIEFISEVAKLISFSFRLFGNIFAGKVLLLVIPFLLSFLVPLPFLGLELFVGLIQAFVFAILTLAFMRMATLSHGESGH